jgi:hypothetical protein
MITTKVLALLGTATLLLASLAALPASVEKLAHKTDTEQARRLREGILLIWLDFLLITAILIWRVM